MKMTDSVSITASPQPEPFRFTVAAHGTAAATMHAVGDVEIVRIDVLSARRAAPEDDATPEG